MMTLEETLQALKSAGSEQTRKTYRRHGVKGEVYGVLTGDMKKIVKRIKCDHNLALALWKSGNHDARILAMTVADPKQATDALLDGWILAVQDYVISDALSGFVGKTPLAREKMEVWIQSPEEWIAATGWNVLGGIAMNDQTLPDAYFEKYIAQIVRDLHSSQNRVRHSMNNALIAIGTRNAALEQKALAAAAQIGKVVVDHGETNCKTPDAAAYIKKTNAYKAEHA